MVLPASTRSADRIDYFKGTGSKPVPFCFSCLTLRYRNKARGVPEVLERITVITTGTDEQLLLDAETRLEETIEPEFVLDFVRLGEVESLRIAYQNVAKQLNRPDDLLMFIHQDAVPFCRGDSGFQSHGVHETVAEMMDGKLWLQVAKRLIEDDSTGLLGVAGARSLESYMAWWNMPAEYLSGGILHEVEDGIQPNFYGGWGQALVLDGVCLMMRGDFFERIELLPVRPCEFHFYDLELSLLSHLSGLKNWTIPFWLIHKSGGAKINDTKWQKERKSFEKIFSGYLPASVENEPLEF